MKKAVIIADDLSGANDVGCEIFENGFKSTVIDASIKTLRNILCNYEGIPILNTASRMLSADLAYKAVFSAVSSAGKHNFIYKKLDSTLRGNIGAEIDACIDAAKIKAAALIPAFPDLNRTTVYGRHFLKGKILENTEYAHDPINPVFTSDIRSLLKEQSKYDSVLVDIDLIRQGGKKLSRFIKLKTGKIPVIFIFDCLNNSDLRNIAKAVKYFKVVAGASALAGYVFPKRKNIISVYPKANPGNAFFVGSVKEITHKQIKKIINIKNIPVYPVISDKPYKIKTKDVVFSVKMTKNCTDIETRKKIETSFKRTAVKLVVKEKYGRLFISGGATAEIIFKALKIGYTEIKDVIIPGVPLTYSPEKKIYIVTKPGGFGEEDALLKIHDRLNLLD